jgi:hypothetical protein
MPYIGPGRPQDPSQQQPLDPLAQLAQLRQQRGLATQQQGLQEKNFYLDIAKTFLSALGLGGGMASSMGRPPR